MSANPKYRPDDQHGWAITLVGSIAMIFTFGTPYSYGIFLSFFGEKYDLTQLTLSTLFSAELFAFYIGAGIIGIIVTNVSSRKILLGVAVVTTLLSPALYIVEGYVGLLIVFVLLGAALGIVYVLLASVVPQWFEQRQGLATGVLFIGNGLGLLILPPAWRWAFVHLGVEAGFLAITVTSGATFFVVGVLCRRPPWTTKSDTSLGDMRAWILQMSRSRSFQLIFVGLGLSFVWYYMLAGFAVKLFVARGMSESTATLAYGAIGGISIASRLTSGAVADRIGHELTFLGAVGLSALASLLLFLPSIPIVLLSVFVFGIGLGAIATMYIPFLMNQYDPEKDTAIVGAFNLSFGFFALASPPLGTVLIDYTGSFEAAILVIFVASIVSILSVRRGSGLRTSVPTETT